MCTFSGGCNSTFRWYRDQYRTCDRCSGRGIRGSTSLCGSTGWLLYTYTTYQVIYLWIINGTVCVKWQYLKYQYPFYKFSLLFIKWNTAHRHIWHLKGCIVYAYRIFCFKPPLDILFNLYYLIAVVTNGYLLSWLITGWL